MDFTYVCPTEIVAFGKLNDEFLNRDCQLLGCSVDSQYVHMARHNDHEDVQNLPLPMLSDLKRELCGALGILDGQTGVAQRATFIVDPKNIIRHVSVNDINVGRNPLESLRVLDAL
jgi:peroxiredoxin (alkyl hydroperoxide reductase subunit C)